MKPEIEAKFLRIDHDAIRARLQELGAVCVHKNRLMKRKNYDFDDRRLEKTKNGWARLRDEGDKVTLSYKQLNDRTLTGTHEVCVTVDNFDAANAFLEELGLTHQVYQESKRESWRLDDVEIELDEWPWVAAFVEIEAATEQAVHDIAAKLGLDMATAVHGSVEIVYAAEYDVTDQDIYNCTNIAFGDVPEWLEAKRRQT